MFDNLKKRYSIGDVVDQSPQSPRGPVMIDGFQVFPARILGHYILSGENVVLPISMIGQVLDHHNGGRRRKSRRANRSRKSRRR